MRKYGVIHCSLVAVRRAPNEKSEMVNQLLFGERVIIHRVLHRWVFIETEYDGSSGWINKLTITLLEEDQLIRFNEEHSVILPRLSRAVIAGTKESYIHLVPGSLLPSYDGKSGEFTVGQQHYKLEKPVEREMMKPERERVIKTGIAFMNAPYLWGGRSPFGIDSPGLVQVVARIHGICLPRNVDQQVSAGLVVNFIDEAEPGDLAFFDDEARGIIHTGIIMGKSRILHASESVRIDAVDHQGIFREDTGNYTYTLRVIRNILDST